jgi:hypothetical protein
MYLGTEHQSHGELPFHEKRICQGVMFVCAGLQNQKTIDEIWMFCVLNSHDGDSMCAGKWECRKLP